MSGRQVDWILIRDGLIGGAIMAVLLAGTLWLLLLVAAAAQVAPPQASDLMRQFGPTQGMLRVGAGLLCTAIFGALIGALAAWLGLWMRRNGA